jgi:C1A family cysteine protease
MEYYERRIFGSHLDASRLFVYKTTRKLLGWTGDTGAYMRTTMQAMALFGAPAERYYPYDVSKFDNEPTAYHYALAQNYQSLSYYRLDSVKLDKKELLVRLKCFLSAGLPFMFGFSVYNFGNAEGEFPYPKPGDRRYGGHAIVAVGFDDNRIIDGQNGAFLIRNSWGTRWGNKGYGWLPYAYILNGLSADFWSLFRMEYLDPRPF